MQPLIIGAGANGLTAAFYLAKSGLRPLVLEARGSVGGAAVAAHTMAPLPDSVMRDMQLAKRVEFVRREPRLIALKPDGPPLALYGDVARTAEAIHQHSPRDASKYPEFCDTLKRIGGFSARLAAMTPPSVDSTTAEAVWSLLKAGRHFRSLGKTDAYRLLRWGPMAVADFAAEWFETDLLQAIIAARGIYGMSQGPWSAGTTAPLLLGAAYGPAPEGGAMLVRGGNAALLNAMRDAALEAGAQIQVDAPVIRILVRENKASAVVLQDGSEIPGSAVISSADPRRTLLSLMDPLDLDPTLLSRARNYRSIGSAAKVKLVLDGLPAFRGVNDPRNLEARIHIGPAIDYVERAFDASKYGGISTEPYLDASVQPLESETRGQNRVLSVHVQYAPYALRESPTWDHARGVLLERVLTTVERYAPDLRSRIVDHEVLTPKDLEKTYGLTGGHIFHGEQSLDQLFVARPFLGCSQYRTPVSGLYLCGAGTHPGGWLPGGPGRNAAREVLKDLRPV